MKAVPSPILTSPAPPELESPEAIGRVDDILGAAGLEHGRRSTRAGTWRAGERRPTGTRAQQIERASSSSVQPVLLHSPVLQGAPAVTHAFSTRAGGVSRVYKPDLPDGQGDLNLGFTAHDDAANVRENRQRFLAALHTRANRFALLQQRHTPIVRVLDDAETLPSDFTAPAQIRGDACMTDRPGVLLCIGTADCVPVLLFDPRRRAVAAFHAGWRGTLARIVERGVGTMRRHFGSDPAHILAAIGPSIGPASYAVSEDLRHDFESQFAYAPALFREVYDSDPVREKYPLLFLTARAPGHSPIGPQLHLDLWEANRRQLLDAGVAAQNIHVAAEDTAADTGRFFSHRAENGFTGRMLSVIGLEA